MKKILLALIIGIILVPQASFAATTPVEDTNAQYQSLVQQLIVLLTQQIQVLQARLDAVEAQQNSTQKGGTIAPMPEEQTIDRVALTKESSDLQESINWNTCRNDRTCTDATRAKIMRINEITQILGFGCTYELTKNNVGSAPG
jgi:hypothetical protein